MARYAPTEIITEYDYTGTSTGSSNGVGFIVLRNTYKGSEYEILLNTNDNDLVTEYGIPMDTYGTSASSSCYIDILCATGFLQDSKYLYSITVKPSSAKYAGTKATSGYTISSSGSPRTSSLSAEKASFSIDTGTFKSREIASTLSTATFGANDAFWLTSSSRGNWGNSIRWIVVDKQTYDAVRYFNVATQEVSYPYGYNITSMTSAASSNVAIMYNNYTSYTSGGSATESVGSVFPTIKSLNNPPTTDKDFILIIQTIPQKSSTYKTVETWPVSIDTSALDDIGRSKYCETTINSKSSYIRFVLNPLIKITNNLTDEEIALRNMNFGISEWQNLTDGSDGTWSQNDEDSAIMAAYDMIGSTEAYEIDTLIDANKSVTVKNYIIDVATNVRKDCMAVIDCSLSDISDTSDSKIASNLITWRIGTTSQFNPNSKRAAIYANWLYVYDKWNSVYRWIPASGHVAGVYARCDTTYYPWFAPSGNTRAILRNVAAIMWNPKKEIRDLIFNEGMNPIITVSGVGTAVIRGETTTYNSSSAFQSVHITKLFNYLERAISKTAQKYLEEPNDDTTRLNFTNEVLPLLKSVKTNRGLDKFQMICDTTNNTSTQLENNTMRADFYLTPTRISSIIQLNFVATQSGADYSEITLNSAYTSSS